MNDTYTDEQLNRCIELNCRSTDWDECGHRGDERCEHARDMEDAARAFIATLDPKPAPHGLTDEQVEALRECDFALQNCTLRDSFPKAFADQSPHPWDEADLQPGEVVVFKLDGCPLSLFITESVDIDYRRRDWTEDATRVTDWQVLRPTWTDKED